MTTPDQAPTPQSIPNRLTALAAESRLAAVARSWVGSVLPEGDAEYQDMFHGPHPDGRYQVVLLTTKGLLIDVVLRSEDDFEFNVYDIAEWGGFAHQGKPGEPETETEAGTPAKQYVLAIGEASNWHIAAGDQATIQALGAFHRRITRWWLEMRKFAPSRTPR